jgi:hypothetical protein
MDWRGRLRQSQDTAERNPLNLPELDCLDRHRLNPETRSPRFSNILSAVSAS